MFTLSFNRTVKSRDLRLIFFLTILLVGFFTYTMLQLIGLHRHAVEKEARPFFNAWVARARDSSGTKPIDRSFCNNQDFDFSPDDAQLEQIGPYRMVNVSCEYYSDQDVVATDGTNVAFVTNMMEFTGSNYIGNQTKSHFVLGLETASVSIQHGAYHPTEGTFSQPPTDILDVHGNIVESIPEFGFPYLSLDLLERAGGLNLDTIKPQTGTPLPRTLRQRNAGIQVAVNIICTNRRDWDFDYKMKCTMSLQPLIEVWGLLPPAITKTSISGFTTTDTINRIGVKFVVSHQVTVWVTEVNAIVAQFSAFISLALFALAVTTQMFDCLYPGVRDSATAETPPSTSTNTPEPNPKSVTVHPISGSPLEQRPPMDEKEEGQLVDILGQKDV